MTTDVYNRESLWTVTARSAEDAFRMYFEPIRALAAWVRSWGKDRTPEYKSDWDKSSQYESAQYWRLLVGHSAEVQESAFRELSRMGLAAVPALTIALRTDSKDVCRAAVRLLGSLGQKGASAPVSVLITVLRSDDEELRRAAAIELGGVEPRGPEVVLALLAALRESSWPMFQEAAADALGRLNFRRPEALDALLTALRDDDMDVRYVVARTLGHFWRDQRRVVPALIDVLQDTGSTVEVREAAADALETIPTGVPTLLATLKGGSERERVAAAYALAQIGPRAHWALPALGAALRDHSKQVRTAAADAIRRIEPDAHDEKSLDPVGVE